MDILREKELLQYLLKQVAAIEEYTSGFDIELFLRDDKTRDASLMKLFVLGEYSSRIDNELKERFNEIEWQFIKAARNFYAHTYRGIDWFKVWETIKNVIPEFKIKIEHIIEVLEKEENGKTN